MFTATRGCIGLSEREKEAERGARRDAEADLRPGGEVGNQRSVDNLHPQPTVGKASSPPCVKVTERTVSAVRSDKENRPQKTTTTTTTAGLL